MMCREKVSVRSIYQSSYQVPPPGRTFTIKRRRSQRTYHYARSVSHCGTSTTPHTPHSPSSHPIPIPSSRYGIRAFDTAPYYDDSEIVLGTALKALEHEFPRSSYQLITKVGRYGGASSSSFDYSPSTLRASVRRSLRRLHTQYLDVVYLHDVEFVASCVAPRMAGNHAGALGAEAEAYGLLEPCEASGDDDERVLKAIETLRSMQADGLILHIGISGPHLRTLSPHLT